MCALELFLGVAPLVDLELLQAGRRELTARVSAGDRRLFLVPVKVPLQTRRHLEHTLTEGAPGQAGRGIARSRAETNTA